MDSNLAQFKLITFSHCKMTHYTKIIELAEILTDFHSKFEPFYQGIVNQTDTINQDCNVANKTGPQLNPNITSGQYLDFSSNSTQPIPRPDDTKG